MNEFAPAKDVAVAGANGYEPAVLAAAVVVKLIHSGSVVSSFRIVKPCNVVCAVKALTAVPPVVTVPEQSLGVTLIAKLAGKPAVVLSVVRFWLLRLISASSVQVPLSVVQAVSAVVPDADEMAVVLVAVVAADVFPVV